MDAGQLQVLLIKRSNFPQKDKWALPGGFVDLTQDADLMASAHRKLVEKRGYNLPFGTSGNGGQCNA